MLTPYIKKIKEVKRDAVTRGHKEFDALDLLQHRAAPVVLRHASASDIDDAHAAVSSHFGDIADPETIKRVAAYNLDNIQIIASARTGGYLGCFTQIMLNAEGVAALRTGQFDPLHPAVQHMAATDHVPAAVYFWAIVATGKAALGIALMSRFLRTERYCRADLYTTPVTDDGKRIVEGLGFELFGGEATPSLYRYRRLARHSPLQAA